MIEKGQNDSNAKKDLFTFEPWWYTLLDFDKSVPNVTLRLNVMINAGKSLIMVLLFDKNDYFSGTILSFVMVLVFVVDCNHFSNSIQKNFLLLVHL